jgi:hypothetical protein
MACFSASGWVQQHNDSLNSSSRASQRPSYALCSINIGFKGHGEQSAAIHASDVTAGTHNAEPDVYAITYLVQGTSGALDIWGHEYMRHLAGEIGEEFRLRREKASEEGGQAVSAPVGPAGVTHPGTLLVQTSGLRAALAWVVPAELGFCLVLRPSA